MITKPDYETAAIKAMELICERKLTCTPIDSLQILLDRDDVRVIPFAEMANESDMKRDDLVPMFGANQDAATFYLHMEGLENVQYVVAYNMRLQNEVTRRAIARELGHIVLGHDGSTRTMDARYAEAKCFAHHLLSPRPIIYMLQESGMPLTMNVLTATIGCSDECVEDMRSIPGVHIPKELNRQVRDQFAKGINEYIRFHRAAPVTDKSPVVGFGTFMDNYED